MANNKRNFHVSSGLKRVTLIQSFHAVANNRRNHNHIPLILHNDIWVKRHNNISYIFTAYSHSLIGTKHDLYYKANHSPLLLCHVDLSTFEDTFSLEKIKRATFDLEANKTLVLDGFPIAFSQKH